MSLTKQIFLFFGSIILFSISWIALLILIFNINLDMILYHSDKIDRLPKAIYIVGLYVFILVNIAIFQSYRKERTLSGLLIQSGFRHLFKGFLISTNSLLLWFLFASAFQLVMIKFNLSFRFTVQVLAYFLIISFLISFIEEILFRGWIYHVLRAQHSSNKAILIQSIIFTVCHFPAFNLSILGLFLSGILLGYCRQVSDSIWYPTGLHMGWIYITICLEQLQIFTFNQDYIWFTGASQPISGLIGSIILTTLFLREYRVSISTK